MTDDDPTLDLARAGMGADLWIVGHAQHGWVGLVKDALVIQSVGRNVPEGPLTDEIRGAARVTAGNGPDIDERHVDVSPKKLDEVRGEAARILTAVAPVLTGMSDDTARQVRHWVMSVAEQTANAASDEFRGEKVSDDERRVIAQLEALLADPDAHPLMSSPTPSPDGSDPR